MQRRLNDASHKLTTVQARLSSGLRINTASDDAAGLSISEGLKTDRRVFNQGVRNLNDGVSMLSIADSAISELTSITTRMAELAEYAANGALSNTQRQSLDKEAQELKSEFSRIINTTEFNNIKLFSNKTGDITIQSGYGVSGGVVANMGGAVGTGHFQPRQAYGELSDITTALVVGDFNNDGNLDILAADGDDNYVSLLSGDGSGAFEEIQRIGVGNGTRGIALGDFNNDGILDFSTANAVAGSLNVSLGNADGTFASSSTLLSIGGAQGITIADFDGDGNADIAVASESSAEMAVHYGAGDGTFGNMTLITTGAPGGTATRGITHADLNGDGLPDIITSDYNDRTVSVHLNDGSGGFLARQTYGVGQGSGIIVADLNGDGILDIATANRPQDSVSVLYGKNDGTYHNEQRFTAGDGAWDLKAADFNGDGQLDLVTTNRNSNTISILLNDGENGFTLSEEVPGAHQSWSVVTGDFNNDGVIDIAAADRGNPIVQVLIAKTTSGISAMESFSLQTESSARNAIPMFTKRIEGLARQRGEIGAFQSRLETALSVQKTKAENMAEANSRIEEADIALEAAEAVRLGILQNTAASLLGQANLQSELALKLLERIKP